MRRDWGFVALLGAVVSTGLATIVWLGVQTMHYRRGPHIQTEAVRCAEEFASEVGWVTSKILCLDVVDESSNVSCTVIRVTEPGVEAKATALESLECMVYAGVGRGCRKALTK